MLSDDETVWYFARSIVHIMRYILVGLFAIIYSSVLAQNIFNSPYSIYGLGIVHKRMSTMNRGMGGTGIAVRDEFNLNYVNPASYGSIVSPINSIYEMGFYVESNRYKTNELTELKTNGSLSNLNYWFKLKPSWSSTVGLSPFSSVSYNINIPRNLGGIENVNYTYDGSGTISQLYWGNSIDVIKNLSIGVNLSYLFGSLSKNESINALTPSGILIFENKITANKFDIDAGIQYVINLRKRKSLVVGLVADDGVSFNAKQKSYLVDGSSDTLNTSKATKLKYTLPASLGVGLSLQTPRSIVAGDLKFENWREADFPEEETSFLDSWKFSAGYMYKGNPEAMGYLGSISLRTGFYLQNYYLRLKEHALPWWGMSFGLSLPVFDNRSSINLTYSFDQLGTLQDGLILQRSQKIMFDVIVRDFWGRKRRFD